MNALLDVVERYKKLFGVLIGLAAVGSPVLALMIGWGPPWPQEKAVAILTALIQLVVIMCGCVYWNLAEPNEEGGSRMAQNPKLYAKTAFGCGVVGLILLGGGYLWAFSGLTKNVNDVIGNVVIGNDLKNDDMRDYLDQQFQGDIGRLIFEQGVDQVYEESGLLLNRRVLLGLWIAAYACLAVVFTSFILYDPRSPQFAGGEVQGKEKVSENPDG